MSGANHDVIVIGAGAGGCTAASLLAKHGLDVLVLEKNDWVGGCCSSLDREGFIHDEGAVFVLCREVYEQLFELLDRDISDYLDLIPIDPVYQLFFPDGSEILVPRDPEAMRETVREISPSDADGWWRFYLDCREEWEEIKTVFETTPRSFEELGTLRYFMQIASHMKSWRPSGIGLSKRFGRKLLHNTARFIDSYFTDPTVKLLMSFETLYAGLPEHRITGLFSSLGVMRHFGYWYPRGGMGEITGSLSRIIGEFGGQVITGRGVARILTEGRRAVGVELEGGERIRAKSVLSNVSARVTYIDMIGRDKLSGPFARAIEGYRMSIAAPVVHLGLRGEPPTRAHMAAIYQPLEQFNEFWKVVYPSGRLIRAEDIPLLITSSSLTDTGLVPEGHCSLSVITGLPYELRFHDWDDIREDFIGDIIRVLEKDLVPGLSERVVAKSMMTPVDMENTYSLTRGAIYGPELSLTNLGPFRPSWRSPVIENLYLAGSWTNPACGVPGAIYSGMMSAAALLRTARG